MGLNKIILMYLGNSEKNGKYQMKIITWEINTWCSLMWTTLHVRDAAVCSLVTR